MTLLALDTSTHWLSVAAGDAAGWTVRNVDVGPGHSGQILPLVQEVLDEGGVSLSALDAIAFGAGPGSFTGVRIACGVAQGLALGAGLPLVPVCSLQAVAETTRMQYGATQVWSVMDARMQEIYAAAWCFDAGVWREVAAPAVMKPQALIAHCQTWSADTVWSIAGDALLAYPELRDVFSWKRADAEVRPTAPAVGILGLAALMRGEIVHARDALPLYVRQRIALTRAEREAGERL